VGTHFRRLRHGDGFGSPRGGLAFVNSGQGSAPITPAQQKSLTAKKQISHPRSPETGDRVRDDNGLQFVVLGFYVAVETATHKAGESFRDL
jgi:hypothetical protein